MWWVRMLVRMMVKENGAEMSSLYRKPAVAPLRPDWLLSHGLPSRSLFLRSLLLHGTLLR